MKTLLKNLLLIMTGGTLLFTPLLASATLFQDAPNFDYELTVVVDDIKIWYNDNHLEVPAGEQFMLISLFFNTPTLSPLVNTTGTIVALDMDMLPDPAVFESVPWTHNVGPNSISIPLAADVNLNFPENIQYHGLLFQGLAQS